MAAQGDPESIAFLADLPSLPEHGAHLWAWFLDLSATRTYGGFGPNRITRLEIHAWEADEGLTLEPWERRAILALDAVWMAEAAPKPTKK